MNWFRFFKNKSGKLAFGIPQMAAVAGVGVLISYGAFHLEQEQIKKDAVRSITSLASADSSTMRHTRSGATSINIKDALGQVATGEDLERINASRTGGGDFGLGAADNIGRNITAGSIGAAAKTSATEGGLGMGANEATVLPGGARSAGGAAGASAGVDAGSLAKASTGRGGTGQLASASMARASGSGVNNSFTVGAGSSSGSSSGGAMASGRMSGGASGEGYQFSGAMPSGSNPVSLGGADGRGASHFVAGSRNGSVGKGRRAGASTGDELKDISKGSAKVAANKYRAANEGARPFLASSQLSGGMTFDNGVETTTTGSADFEAAELGHIRGIKDWGDTVNTDEQTRNKWVQGLMYGMMALIALTAFMCPFIRTLSQIANSPYTLWAKGLAIALMAIVIAAAVALITCAGIYWGKYMPNRFSWLGMLSCVAGAGSIAAVLIAFLGVQDKSHGANLSKEEAFQIKGNLKGLLKPKLKEVGMTVGLPAAKTAGEHLISSTDGSGTSSGKGSGKGSGRKS